MHFSHPTQIKYDRLSAKILKWTGIFCAVLFVLGGVMLLGEIDGTELLMLVCLYMGGGVGIVSALAFIGSIFYFKRLEKYGYEIPYKRSEYARLLRNVPRNPAAKQEEQKSLCSKESKILAGISLILFVVCVGMDIHYYITWSFMGENCSTLFVLTLLFYCIWLIFALVMYKQSNPLKYRDDVETDMTRKERLSIEQGLLTCLIFFSLCLFANETVHSMTDYMYRSMLEEGMEFPENDN